MSQFDIAPAKTGDWFVRHDPKFLNMVFGTNKITPLWVADMDLPIAAPITKALQNVVSRGQYGYEFNSSGVFSAISNWYQDRHDLALAPGNFVQLPGVLTAIAVLIRQVAGKGEGVIVQFPAYHQFAGLVTSAGRKLVKSPLINDDGKYKMDFSDLEQKFQSDEVKAMILCNPHNPVGRVWTGDELNQLATLADKHGVTIISDEIHSDIIFEGHKFHSLMADHADNHFAVIGSPAKTFGMQSISNGYVYSQNKALLKQLMNTVDSMHLAHGNAFTTHATIAAYQKGGAWLDELLSYLAGTVDWIEEFLQKELPEVRMIRPEGTYQIWLDCTDTGLEGDALKEKLALSGMGATPGTWFDPDAKEFIRINITAPRADIQGALRRFKEVL